MEFCIGGFMNVLDRIDEKLNEADFAKGKSAMYLAGYLDQMMVNWQGNLRVAKATGDYGTAVNSIVSSALNDLTKMKKQLDKMAKTGKV